MSDPPGVALASARGRWLLAVTVLGSAMGFLDATVVNVALPSLGRSLHAGVSGLQWTLDGYLLTLTALILLGGSLGDRLGRRRIYVFGAGWFALASLLCALAPSIEALVAARVLQGVGGALLIPGSLAIIEATLRREDRGRAIGAWSGLTGIASALGPLLGGWLITAVSWRAIFLINLPIGALVVWGALRHLPGTDDARSAVAIDWGGGALGCLGLGGVTYALIELPGEGLGTATGAALLAGLAALAALLARERRIASPMLPLEIFASRRFSAANAVTFVVYGALGGVLFLLVVFMQVVLGYSPLAAGAALLPVTILMLVLSARTGALALRVGPRLPLTVGPLLLAGGMLLMSRLGARSSYGGGVLPAVVVFGLGLAATVAPITATALGAVEDRHAGIASAVNNAVARAAQLLAVAALPALAGLSGAAYRRPRQLSGGFHVAMLFTSGLAAAGAALAFFLIRGRDGAPPAAQLRGVPPGAQLRGVPRVRTLERRWKADRAAGGRLRPASWAPWRSSG